MPILTPTRLKTLCPELATVADPQLESIILRAQTIVESPLGCDRPLEKMEHKENKRLDVGSQTCYIDLLPLDLNQRFDIEARFGSGNYHPTKGRPLSPSKFRAIDDNAYFLNELTGELNLTAFLTSPIYNAFGRFSSNFANYHTEINVTYTGGYDFDGAGNTPSDREIIDIQVLLSEVVKYMSRGFFTGEGVKSKSVDNWYKLEYVDNSSGVEVGSIPSALLVPFRKYGRNLREF